MQFIVTSHSPIVVGTLHRANVLVLETREKTTAISPARQEVYGRSADQILTSEHFGLKSARNAEFARRLTRVAKNAQDDPEAALRFMRMMTLGAGADAGEPPPRRRATAGTSRAPTRPKAKR